MDDGFFNVLVVRLKLAHENHELFWNKTAACDKTAVCDKSHDTFPSEYASLGFPCVVLLIRWHGGRNHSSRNLSGMESPHVLDMDVQ